MQVLANQENKRRKETYKSSGEEPDMIRNLLKKIHDSDKVRIDYQSIELRRQLAYNGLTSITNAVWETVKTSAAALMAISKIDPKAVAIKAANIPKNVTKMVELMGKLDNWVMAHPLEAQRFAGNLRHAYDAFQNRGLLDAGVKRGSIENILKAKAEGSKAHVHAEDAADGVIDVMPPELLALLYVADWLPEVTRMGGAVAGSGWGGVIAYGAATLVSAPMLLAGAAAAGIGYMQASAERKIAGVVTENRDLEMTITALVDAVKENGNFKDTAKAFAKKMIVVQTLEAVGDLQSTTRRVGKLGAVKAMWDSLGDWWNESSAKEKAVFIGTQFVLPVLGAGAFVAGSILTGGALPLVTAIGYGISTGVTMFLGSAVGQRLKYRFFDRAKQEKVRELETNRRLAKVGVQLDLNLPRQQAVLDNLKKRYGVSDEEVASVKRESKDEILAHTLTALDNPTHQPAQAVNTAFSNRLVEKAQNSPAGASLDDKDKTYWETEAKKFQDAMEASLGAGDEEWVHV